MKSDSKTLVIDKPTPYAVQVGKVTFVGVYNMIIMRVLDGQDDAEPKLLLAAPPKPEN